jgi:DNA-binding NarL/FixJ family response regulator
LSANDTQWNNDLSLRRSRKDLSISGDEVSVFLLCENRLLREALLRILGKRAGLIIVGASACSPDALRDLLTCQPQVILLDCVGEAVAQPLLLRYLHEALPAARTVMVGMEQKEEHFFHSVREGAAGYVLREASAAEVIGAIRAVAAGEAVCPPCFSAMLFRCASQQLAIRQNLQSRSPSELSRREEQLVESICGGLTNKEIAVRLHLSEHTVKNHIHNILKKTGASDRVDLIDRYRGQFPSQAIVAPPFLETTSSTCVLPPRRESSPLANCQPTGPLDSGYSKPTENRPTMISLACRVRRRGGVG